MKIKIIGIVLAVVLVLSLCMIPLFRNEEEAVYKETAVTYGKLTVGITESGNVTVGTTEQEFGLDISAFSNSGTGFGMGEMMGGMPGMFQASGSSSSSSDDKEIRELEVEEVYISVGQRIEKGDALFKLTAESVAGIRQELETDVSDAKLALEQLQTEQKSTRLTAAHTYEKNTIYGQAAQLEYEEAVNDLTTALTDANLALGDKKEELAGEQERLSELQEKYAEDKRLLNEAEYLLKVIDIDDGEDLYGYVVAEDSRETAAKTVEVDEDDIEKQEETIAALEKEIINLEKKLTEAQKAKRTGDIEAVRALEERNLYYNNASEIYGIDTEMIEDDLNSAQEEYGDAQAKLEDFDTYIVDGIVSAEYSGVITEVSVASEDTIENNQTLLALNNYDDVTIAVDIKESDIDEIKIGDEVHVNIAALPDESFTGTVTEIGDAEVNSSTSVITYEVTVTISGNLTGVYENMTGDVTFITKETKEVLQLVNRAVIREGAKSYVKVKDGEGNIVKKEITTGFSDGVNVEIVEGLSEGDVVLIESKVSDS